MNIGRSDGEWTTPRVFEYIRMKPLAWSDRAKVDQMLRQFQPNMSDYTFSNLFAWNEPTRWIGWHECHLILGHQDGNSVCLLQPIGDDPASIIESLSDFKEVYWEPIEKSVAESLSDILVATSLREHFDYVYKRQNLITLGGPRLSSYRTQVRHFVKEYAPYVRKLTSDDMKDCQCVMQRWSENKPANEWLMKESIALNRALDNFDTLKLQSLGVFLSSRLEAFVLGEWLNSNTLVVHYTKTSIDVRGLAPYLINKCSANIRPRLVSQLGHKPRRLQENAINCECLQLSQYARAQPCAKMPQLRYELNASITSLRNAP